MLPTGRKSAAIDRPLDPRLIARFSADLAALWGGEGRLGLAVSGGPDSLAMLVLAHAAIPGRIAVATVDHGLRPESAGEAAMVAGVCAGLGVAHRALTVTVADGNLQDRARAARYAALAGWMAQEGLAALATAHHADDQAETLVMRLNRGSGLAGLAGVRGRGLVPGTDLPVIRPLLGWRREELVDVIAAQGWAAVQDPSNSDDRFDRVRVRKALAAGDWLDVSGVARSAAHLADADEALAWAAEHEWDTQVCIESDAIHYRPVAPRAIRLRVLDRAIARFGGSARGSAVAELVDRLAAGEGGTLGGVQAINRGGVWIIAAEPPRNC